MKKRVLMILMIILVILLIPRYNRNCTRTKNNHGHRLPHRKIREESDDFELPFPAIRLLIGFVPDKIRKVRALNIPFIDFINKCNTYKPFYRFVGISDLT